MPSTDLREIHLKGKTSSYSSASRREARERARAAAAAAAAARGAGAADNGAANAAAAPLHRRPAWRSPLALIVGGVAVIAVVAILAIAILPKPGPSGPTAPGSRSAAGILVPATGTPTNVAFGRFLGRPDAPVRLIVWSDFQCQPCKAFAEGSELKLIHDYVVPGKLRIEYRDLAVVGVESSAAAAAARCADQQGKFWPYHDVLFANQGTENTGLLVPQRLKDMADALGLDRTKFDACLPSGDIFNEIEAETHQGQGLGSSASILDFGSVVLDGSPDYPVLSQTIDTLIKNAPATSSSVGPGASAGATATASP